MWFAIMIASVWFFSAISTVFTKSDDVFLATFYFSAIAGVGYFLLKVS
jgi:hypothetical protein